MKKLIIILMILFCSMSVSAIDWYTPLAYYPLDGNGLDEGPRGFDLEGKGTTYVAAIVGAGFDGEESDEDNLNYNATGPDLLGITTIEIWFKAESFNGGVIMSLTDRSNGVNNRITFQQEGASGNIRFLGSINGSAWEIDSTTTPCTLGTWCHLVGVIDVPSDITFYINNVSIGTAAHDHNIGEQFDTISVCNRVIGTFCDGVTDNFFLTNATYTAENVSIAYNAGNGQNFSEAAPAGAPSILSFNITSAYANQTAATGLDIAYVRTSTPSIEITLSSASNVSCGIYNLNYSAMIANDSTTKAATTDTADHTCTIPINEALSEGVQRVYIGVADSGTAIADAEYNISLDWTFIGSTLNSSGGAVQGINVMVSDLVTNDTIAGPANTFSTAVSNSTGGYTCFVAFSKNTSIRYELHNTTAYNGTTYGPYELI